MTMVRRGVRNGQLQCANSRFVNNAHAAGLQLFSNGGENRSKWWRMSGVARCAYCSARLTPHAGRGRPSRYCGAACRRCAEAELRRADRRIAALDEEITWAERHVAGIGYSGSQDRAVEKLQFIEAQRAKLLLRYETLVRHHEAVE